MSYTRENAGTYRPSWGKVYLGTPVEWWNILDKEFGFNLDVAADDEFHMTDRYFTYEDDALKLDWKGTVWLSPPWAEEVVHHWVAKAVDETKLNYALVVAMLPVRTNTRWWHDYVLKNASEIRFIDGDLVWRRMDHEADAYSVEPACLVIFKPGSGSSILVTSYSATEKIRRKQ